MIMCVGLNLPIIIVIIVIVFIISDIISNHNNHHNSNTNTTNTYQYTMLQVTTSFPYSDKTNLELYLLW